MQAGGRRGIVVVVAALSDLLHRFRRLGTPPGPPAAGLGVPARTGASLAAELQPVFAEVDAVEEEAGAIRAAAEPEARGALAAAREQAARIREEGARHAERERVEVSAASEQRSRTELARIAAEAEAEAARIARVAAAHRAELAARVVDQVRGGA